MAITVSPIGKNNPVAPVVTPLVTAPPPASPASKASAVTVAPVRMDAGLSSVPSATYTRAQATGNQKSSAMDKILSRMAEKIITKQYSEGNQFYKLLYGHIALRIDPNLRSKDMGPSREELLGRAREMVGENGPFSPANVAGQIVGFVSEMSNGDQARTERFREAVQEAFAKLASMSGGEMPELTQKTYHAVMESLETVTEPQSPADMADASIAS